MPSWGEVRVLGFLRVPRWTWELRGNAGPSSCSCRFLRVVVVVVDDHPIMRDGLRDALEASGRFEVVGLAEDGEEAVRTVEGLGPEVIVMDVMMPGKDGIEACREIMELLPDTRVLMLTASNEEDAVIEAVAAGATSYLQKYSRPGELVEAVVDAAEGRLRIPGKTVREVFAMVRGLRELASRQATDRLTAVERETLTLFAGGMPYTGDCPSEGQHHLDRPEHHLPHTGQAESRDETGTRDLGRAERPDGRRGRGPKAGSRIVFSLHGIDGMEAMQSGHGVLDAGWCGKCFPGDGSGRMSRCYGFRIRRKVTSGPGAPTPSGAAPSAHPQTSRLEPALNFQSGRTNWTSTEYSEWLR